MNKENKSEDSVGIVVSDDRRLKMDYLHGEIHFLGTCAETLRRNLECVIKLTDANSGYSPMIKPVVTTSVESLGEINSKIKDLIKQI